MVGMVGTGCVVHSDWDADDPWFFFGLLLYVVSAGMFGVVYIVRELEKTVAETHERSLARLASDRQEACDRLEKLITDSCASVERLVGDAGYMYKMGAQHLLQIQQAQQAQNGLRGLPSTRDG